MIPLGTVKSLDGVGEKEPNTPRVKSNVFRWVEPILGTKREPPLPGYQVISDSPNRIVSALLLKHATSPAHGGT
jgi:hypothetical protein